MHKNNISSQVITLSLSLVLTFKLSRYSGVCTSRRSSFDASKGCVTVSRVSIPDSEESDTL